MSKGYRESDNGHVRYQVMYGVLGDNNYGVKFKGSNPCNHHGNQ